MVSTTQQHAETCLLHVAHLCGISVLALCFVCMQGATGVRLLGRCSACCWPATPGMRSQTGHSDKTIDLRAGSYGGRLLWRRSACCRPATPTNLARSRADSRTFDYIIEGSGGGRASWRRSACCWPATPAAGRLQTRRRQRRRLQKVCSSIMPMTGFRATQMCDTCVCAPLCV